MLLGLKVKASFFQRVPLRVRGFESCVGTKLFMLAKRRESKETLSLLFSAWKKFCEIISSFFSSMKLFSGEKVSNKMSPVTEKALLASLRVFFGTVKLIKQECLFAYLKTFLFEPRARRRLGPLSLLHKAPTKNGRFRKLNVSYIHTITYLSTSIYTYYSHIYKFLSLNWILFKSYFRLTLKRKIFQDNKH